jgi:hypothetical protein
MLPTVKIRTASVPVAVVPFALAAISTLRVAVTAVVVTLNVTNVLPLGTFTVAGTVAATFDDVSCTVVPAAGATPVSVTVPMEVLPPRTAAGANVTDAGRAACTVKTPVADEPFAEAVNVTAVSVETTVVATTNVAVVAPGSTFTVAEDLATTTLLLVTVTTSPVLGAGVARLIVPVVATFPATTAGEKVTDPGCDNRTLTEAVTDVPLADAETVTFALEVTAVDVAWKVALVCPAATVTVAGTAKDPAEELSPTT